MRREVLFVCTGNVFRSLTAEYAHVVPPEISGYLMQKGLDVSRHVRRTLTREIAGRARLLVAMSVDHRDFIHARFGRSAPLFLECCGEAPEGLLDLHEAVRDPRASPADALAYLRSTIDRIIDLTPRLARRIDTLLQDGP